MKIILYALLFLLLTAPAFAQESDTANIADKDKSSSYGRDAALSGEAARLLKSETNRERAWGAYLVGRHDLKEHTACLVELLGDPTFANSSSWGERVVRQAALDALIRLDAKVPADALLPLYYSSRDEVIILLAPSPQEHQGALLNFFDEQSNGLMRANARWLAVGNLLAETKAKGFAASLLRDLKFEWDVTVLDRERDLNYGRGGNGGCGGGADGVPDGFPPVSFYTLTTQSLRGAVVVAPGVHPVYFLRVPNPRHIAGCDSLADADTYRVEYLATLLDTSEEELNLNARTSRTVVCKDALQCRRSLAGLRGEIARAYVGAISRLVEAGLMSGTESAPQSPDITFHLDDERLVKSFPLPNKLKGVKISVE